MSDMSMLAKYIDHTVLKPETTSDSIIKLCQEAEEHQFAAVCINPVYVDLASHLLRGTGVKVATVIGFPLGATFTEAKEVEVKEAIARKADELDMVMLLSAAKSGQWDAVTEDIRRVVQVAEDKTVKVIVETCFLNLEEKRRACQAVLESGAHFIKTSTGFGSGGATEEDIRLFSSMIGGSIGIKASGGIRTREQAEKMIRAGATRLGTSAGVSIVQGAAPTEGTY